MPDADEPTAFLEKLADNLGLTAEQRVELRANHARWSAELAPFDAALERSMDPGDTSIRVSGGAPPAARPAGPPPNRDADSHFLMILADTLHSLRYPVETECEGPLDRERTEVAADRCRKIARRLRAAPPPGEEYGNPHREQPGWIKDNPPFAKQGDNWPPPLP